MEQFNSLDKDPQFSDTFRIKKKFHCIIVLLSAILFCSIAGNIALVVMLAHKPLIPKESIIPVTSDISVNGTIMPESAAWYINKVNVKNSPYYPINNFYDGSISKTLKILPKFKTYQQSSKISCGAASAFMALRYLGVNNVTENELYIRANTEADHGVDTIPLAKAIRSLSGSDISVKYKLDDRKLSIEETIELFKECTNPDNKKVLLLASVEWGGHWMTLIGYDDMGTELTDDDVLVFADPFDTTDHNQDGYYITSFERYYATWFLHNMGKEGQMVNQYVIIEHK